MSTQFASGWVVEFFEKSTHNKVDVIATIESTLASDNSTRVSKNGPPLLARVAFVLTLGPP